MDATFQDLLKDIRMVEGEMVAELISGRHKLLEVGPGEGWQTKRLAAAGHSVVTVGVVGVPRQRQAGVPHVLYDGTNLPFRDRCFDLIFSSNVLEHVAHLDGLLAEMKRVLAPPGKAIHVVPTPGWLFWTTLGHYAARFGRLMHAMIRRNKAEGVRPRHLPERVVEEATGIRCGWWRLLPPRHGARGTRLSEWVLYGRRAWRGVFAKAGWSVVGTHPNRIFYTGHLLGGRWLTIDMRRKLSGLLGSSARIYVVIPNSAAAPNGGRRNSIV